MICEFELEDGDKMNEVVPSITFQSVKIVHVSKAPLYAQIDKKEMYRIIIK